MAKSKQNELVELVGGRAVVDVNGVGYLVHIGQNLALRLVVAPGRTVRES